ncbi:MAG: hypothetical protein FH749_15500 [Firmicutes bacterium]|nr:hypothetical protein [Bacillota bacterium]
MINNKTVLLIFGGLVVALAAFIVLRGLGEDPLPDPVPDGEDNGQVEDVEYDTFAGRLFVNEQELELDNEPLVDKGLIYLPVLELVDKLDAPLTYDQDTGSLLVAGSSLPEDADEEEGIQVYREGTAITPGNVIELDDELYISGRELAPLLRYFFYENLFANEIYLVDASVVARDGTYTAVRHRDARGWASELTMTIVGGEITEVTYDEYDEEREAKFASEGYLENWQGNNPDVDPVALRDQLQAQLLEVQHPADVDLTSGATGTYKQFVELASVTLAQARRAAVVPPLTDGEYIMVGPPSATGGWMPWISVEVADGRITQVIYDDIDENLDGKRENEGYLQNWRNAYPEVDPVAIIAQREENIVQTQDPNTVDATTGATAWGTNMKKFITGGLDHAQLSPLGTVSYDQIYVLFGEANDNGDRPQLLLATSDGQLVLVDFSDYRNGIPKKLDNPYLNRWQDQYPDVEPVELVLEMEQTFLETLDPDELDAISGATGWRDSFQELARRAIELGIIQ